MEKKIDIHPISDEIFDQMMKRYGEILAHSSEARDIFWKFVQMWTIRKRPTPCIWTTPITKEIFIFLVAEGQIISSPAVRNYEFAEALFEFLTSHKKYYMPVITDLVLFLDNLFQEVKFASTPTDGLRAVDVQESDIPKDAEAMTKALKKHYNETFQASNGMWIFTHRHLSGVTY
jgi:hypothetical protein